MTQPPRTRTTKPPAKPPARRPSGPVLFAPVVERTIRSLVLGPGDEAAAHLARTYARAIDDARRFRDPEAAVRMLDRLGPKLLAVLDKLGGTPTSRSKLLGGTGAPPAGDPELDEDDGEERPPAPVGWLDAMRDARAARESTGG